MVSQSQKSWFVGLIFGYTPSYTWSPSLLTHHPTGNTCSKSSPCPKRAHLDMKNWKNENSTADSHPMKCFFCYSGSLQANQTHTCGSVGLFTTEPQILQVTFSYPTSLHYHMGQLKHKYIHPPISRGFPKTAPKRFAQCSKTKQHFFSAKKKIHISIRFCLQNIHQINFLTFPLTIQIKVTAIHVTSQSSNLEEHHYSSEMDKVALNNSTNNLARRNFWNTKAELWIDVNRITLQ